MDAGLAVLLLNAVSADGFRASLLQQLTWVPFPCTFHFQVCAVLFLTTIGFAVFWTRRPPLSVVLLDLAAFSVILGRNIGGPRSLLSISYCGHIFLQSAGHCYLCSSAGDLGGICSSACDLGVICSSAYDHGGLCSSACDFGLSSSACDLGGLSFSACDLDGLSSSACDLASLSSSAGDLNSLSS
jgi:hypothetical protein